METLFNQDRSGVLIVGAGSLGTAAAQHSLENRGEQGTALWTAVHFNAAELIATGLEKKILIRGNPAMFSDRALERAIDENLHYLRRLIQGRRTALLCAELADEHAVRLLAPLCAALNESIPCGLLLLKPFEAAAAEFNALPPATFTVIVDSGMDTVTRGISVRKLRAIAAQRLAATAECFASALDSGAGFDIPSGEFEALFSEHEGADSVLSAVTGALRHCESGMEREAVSLLLLTARELPLRTLQTIREKLSGIHSQNCAIVGAADVTMGERSTCLLLRTSANSVRDNIVSLTEAVKAGAAWR